MDETLPSLVHYDDIPALDVVVSIDDQKKKVCMSVVQKRQDRPLTVALNFRGLRLKGSTMEVSRLTGDSLNATNTLDSPNNVGVETETKPITDVFTFPPASLTVLELDIE